jgi:hypothetical protein
MRVRRGRAVPFGQTAVQHERHEAHEESDGLRADEVLGVHDRRDRRTDEPAHDLADEDGSREEGEEPLRLRRVVEVAGVDPEEDVDRLLDSVREHVRDRLDDVADERLPDERLDGDAEQRRHRDVPQKERAPAHAIDEEEDHRRDREHRDRRDDVHDRYVLDAVALHEERVGAELSHPVGGDHERQQPVEEEAEAPFTTTERKRGGEQRSQHRANPAPSRGPRREA